jgi:hypothetical protein
MPQSSASGSRRPAPAGLRAVYGQLALRAGVRTRCAPSDWGRAECGLDYGRGDARRGLLPALGWRADAFGRRAAGQFEFAHALLRAAKAHGLHTCLDTSGLADWRKLAAIGDAVDLFLYDYKATDPAQHKALTGVANHLILKNLDHLYRHGAQILLRCPLIPGLNDSAEHLAGIASLSARYPGFVGVEIMAYHNLGRDKAARIGYHNPLADLASADATSKQRWLDTLHGLGCTRARLG